MLASVGARPVAASAATADSGEQCTAGRLAEVLDYWGSLTDADAAAVAQLLQDVGCTHADKDHQAGARQLLGSCADADAAAVAKLLQDANCAHADGDHQAPVRHLLGSCADADADAVAKLLQDADITDDPDSEHHACVRELLESCLQEAAERARSQTTQGSSSTVTTRLLLLGEDTGSFSSSSGTGSYPAAATDSGAVTIDW